MHNTPSNIILTVENLRIGFNGNANDVVKDISFSIPAKSTVALVGESGSGKSVTALAIMGLLEKENTHIAATSRIQFAGKNLLELPMKKRRKICGKAISIIFQEPMTSLNPVFTIGFQITEVLRIHMGIGAARARKRTLQLLEEVGIPSPEININAYPNQLSGGQQQRVMIAMAIACEPTLLIADEPTTALDVTIQKQIIELINTLRTKRNMSVLFITHDLALVGEMADQIIVMRDGEIREIGEVKQIFEHPKDVYTNALLHCRPSLTTRPWRLPVIDDYIGSSTRGCPHFNRRSEKSAERGQISPDLPRQYRNIDQKSGEIWTAQVILQPPIEMRTAPSQPDQKQRTRGLHGNETIVLEVQHLSKSFYRRIGFFGREEFKAVEDVSFQLARGKTLGIVGESGSGKTTLGLTLLRLHQATAGQALFEGKNILAMSDKQFMPYKKRIQIIFQNPYASLNPRFTVGQILLEPMRIHRIGENDEQRVAMAYELLDKVHLPTSAFHRYPHEFSGGQRQRIAIARCLTMKPDILVCDESVSALDVSIQAQILNLLQDLQDEFGLSYLFISHDLTVVKYIADQVMVMHHGRVVELANSDDLYLSPHHEYTRTLLNAIPRGIA